VASARIARVIARMEQGNFSNAKGVGEGVLEYKIDFGPGYWAGRRHDRHLAHGRYEEAAATGYRCGKGVLARLQAEPARTALRRAERQMAKTGSFKELVQTRVKNDKKFAEALLREGIDAMLSGDVETGKTILRDYIKATVGFEKLGEATGTQPKSLIRMFGPRGNPQAKNLFGVLGYLQKRAGLKLHVA